MAAPKKLKCKWKTVPLGRVGAWCYGTAQGRLGTVWYANGQWWAESNGHDASVGGFPSEGDAIKYVERNAQGLPGIAPPPGAPPSTEPGLEEILGGKDSQAWTRYWKTMACWPKDKNPSPKHSAKAWLAACEKSDPKTIYLAALNYKDLFLPPKRPSDESRFMQGIVRWLEGEGWHSTREEP